MRWLYELYREYLAYEYFSPGLMRMTYSNLDASALSTMFLVLLVFCLIYGLVPLFLWGLETALIRWGGLRGRASRVSRRILVGSCVIAFLAALNSANNLLLSINN